MPYYIFSTLSRDNLYTEHNRAPDGNLVAPLRKVLVRGGANVVQTDKRSGALHTPKGVVTTVSDDDFAFLQTDHTFKLHEKNGYIRWEKMGLGASKTEKIKNHKGEVVAITEQIPSGLKEKDPSAQKTKSDFVDASGNPLTGKNHPGLTGALPK